MIDRFKELDPKDVGAAIRMMSRGLDRLSNESFSRSGWDNFDELVDLFQSMTGYTK